MDIKVSVIIPVYNGENYLEQCLNSVCGQTLREIEIICVDDGSTDSSYEILNNFAKEDERIRVLQQENLYAGAARNNGKRHAKGEYLVFWDCDDFFDAEALEKMYNRSVEVDADICVCGGNHYYENLKQLSPFSGYLTKSRIPEENLFNRTTNEDFILSFTNEATWNKMFRRAFIEKEELDFQCVRNGNDVYFTVCAMCLAERITTVQEPLINYRKNQKNSLVSTLSKSADTPFKAWIAAAEHLEERNAFPEKSFVNKFTGSMMYLLRNIQETEAFMNIVEFLQKEGLEKLHVRDREDDFYYNIVHADFTRHILSDSPKDFQTYLAHLNYIELTNRSAELRLYKQETKEEIRELKRQIRELSRENRRLDKQLTETVNSWSFRIGKKIVWLPGKIKRLFKKRPVEENKGETNE